MCQAPGAQQTQDIDPMLVQFWPTVYDVGPPLNQHWVNVTCFVGKCLYIYMHAYMFVYVQ